MEFIESILLLLSGIGAFIIGMSMMSDALQKTAGGGMKQLLSKISDNRFAGVGIGAAVTAIIQSSSATSVMVIGFVNAGVMTLKQAAAIIMGANIGTTVTGLIVSLSAFDVSLYAAALAFVGVVMTFMKSDRVRRIGIILCGLGLLFIGLDIMGGAFNKDITREWFSEIFSAISAPPLLLLVGVIFTALVQSSSAATGLTIIMVGQGALPVESAFFIVLGSNIGTCVTALIACIGANVNALRTAFIHLAFNIFGSIVVFVPLWIFSSDIATFLASVTPSTEMQIAWFHVVFNLLTTALLLPFLSLLVKLATALCPEKKSDKEETMHFKYIDERLLRTPQIAMMQVKREVAYMATVAEESLNEAFRGLLGDAETNAETIRKNEERVDFTNNELSNVLIQLSPHLSGKDEVNVGAYFHVTNDIERIGDHAENFYEITVGMRDQSLAFSDEALAELRKMYEKVAKMFTIAINIFAESNSGLITELAALEDEVDTMKNMLASRHFSRLSLGKCKANVSAYFFSTVHGLERVADHLVNIGYSIVSPTGDEDAYSQ